MILNPGKMRHRVTVVLPPGSLDERGQEVGAETPYLTSQPCSIETLSAREQEAARQKYGEVTHRLRMYAHRSKPLENYHRIKWGDKTLEIGGVFDPENLGLEYEILCSEVVA